MTTWAAGAAGAGFVYCALLCFHLFAFCFAPQDMACVRSVACAIFTSKSSTILQRPHLHRTRAVSVRAIQGRRDLIIVSSGTDSNGKGSSSSRQKAPSNGRPSRWLRRDERGGDSAVLPDCGPSWWSGWGIGIGICCSYGWNRNRASLRSCLWDGSYTPFYSGRNAYPRPFTAVADHFDKLFVRCIGVGLRVGIGPQLGRRFGIRQRWRC